LTHDGVVAARRKVRERERNMLQGGTVGTEDWRKRRVLEATSKAAAAPDHPQNGQAGTTRTPYTTDDVLRTCVGGCTEYDEAIDAGLH
jgi:hypothetical protein